MNTSSLTSAQADQLIAVTGRYLDFLRRPRARMEEVPFPDEDCLNEATRLLLPHVEEHATVLAELKTWIDASRPPHGQILPCTRHRERARYVPPKKDGDVF